MRLFISFILIITILSISSILPNQSVYANTDDGSVSVSYLGNETYKIATDGTIGVVRVAKIDSSTTRATVTENGETYYFELNSKTNQLYSSITNKTVQLSDTEIKEIIDTGKVSATKSSSSVGEIRTYKFSYKRIKDEIGTVGAIASIAGVIVLFLSWAGLAVPAIIGQLSTLLGGITGLISLISEGSSSHGLKVKMQSYWRTVKKSGKEYKIIAWKPIAVSKY